MFQLHNTYYNCHYATVFKLAPPVLRLIFKSVYSLSIVQFFAQMQDDRTTSL